MTTETMQNFLRQVKAFRRNPGRSWRVQGESKPHEHFEAHGTGEFDELVIDDWFHLEQMDKRHYWFRAGERAFDIYIPTSGDVEVIEQ